MCSSDLIDRHSQHYSLSGSPALGVLALPPIERSSLSAQARDKQWELGTFPDAAYNGR